MSLLTVIIATASILFIIIGRDAYKRNRMNLMHWLIFVCWGLFVTYSLMYPSFLDRISKVFGLARWVDILIYGSILTLTYFYFELVNKNTKDGFNFTKFITNEALSHVDADYIKNAVAPVHHYATVSWKWDQSHSTTQVHKHSNISKSDFMFHVKGLNESKTIGKVIDDIIWAWFSKILVVNDWSTDDMPDIVREKIQQYDDKLIVLVNHLINRRHGWWNKTGIQFFRKFGKACDIKYVVFYDADDQMDISDMESYIDFLQEHQHIDVIQWSRFVDGGVATNMPLMRKVILFGAKLLTRIFNGMRITDPHNGYKCFRLSSLCLINLHTDTTAYANELIDEYRRLGFKVVELPVHIKYTDYSLGKGQKNNNAINILLELIYRKFFYR